MTCLEYPEYKDSGVEWLGGIPEHWKVKKLKYLISKLESGVSVNAADMPAEENEIGVLKTSCVYTRKFRSKENKTVFEEEKNRVKCPVRKDTIIISRMNTPDLVGASAFVEYDFENLYLPDRLWKTVFFNDSLQSSKFISYFMMVEGFRDEISNYAEGASSSMQNIAKEDYLSIPVLLPAIEEQTQIATFLDRETQKIDRLIEKQQQLIKLLQEKRQAVISHAVTKGLNPHAKMKDSGVEWLGEIPAHWDIKRVRYAFQIDNKLRTPIDKQTRAEIAGKYPYYGPTGVLNLINKYNVNGEYFLLGEDGDHFLKFKKRPMTILVNGQFNVNNHAHLIKGKGSCSTKWGCLYFEHMDLFPWLIKQGVGRYKLRKETLVDIPILVPPEDEQELILKEIDKKKSMLSSIVSRAEIIITTLQERRTALISAAVTGKIDVRNVADG